MSAESNKPWPVWMVFGEEVDEHTKPEFREFATRAELIAFLKGVKAALGLDGWNYFYTEAESLEYIREELDQESEVEA